MNKSRYIDSDSTIQVIGCILQNPDLLEDEGRYFFSEEDFPIDLHRIIFSVVFNLHQMGAKNININTIEDYLSDRIESLGIYKAKRGAEWIKETYANADLANFNYYYNRLKKMTLLREYDRIGVDVTWLFDPDQIVNPKERQNQRDYMDQLSLEEIADLIDKKIANVRAAYVDNASDEGTLASEGIEELFASFEESPDVGQPMYGKLINTVTRGMRLGKFYLRSAASGVGKTRTMIADFCNCGCSKIYLDGEWQDNGLALPAVFISTELELDELQTMMVAFLADINEENILNNVLSFDEKVRVKEAIKVIQDSPLYVEVIPDFSLKDIENTIKRNIRVHGVKYVFLDYIHTSMKILEEITRRSGGIKLREDNVLFLLSVKLKEIATQFNIFILSSTQLNQDWKISGIPDQNLLRGAKSIADKIDYGSILLDVTEEDRQSLSTLFQGEMTPDVMPNVKLSVYKNRRGSYNKCYLWMYANKSTCRFNAVFCTDYNYEIIPITETIIKMRV